MGAGEIKIVAQKIGEMGAWLHGGLDGARVHGQRDHGHLAAPTIARRSTATWMCRSAVIRPPKSAAASPTTIGGASTAPMTARALADSGSISTAAIAWANSPVLRQALT